MQALFPRCMVVQRVLFGTLHAHMLLLPRKHFLCCYCCLTDASPGREKIPVLMDGIVPLMCPSCVKILSAMSNACGALQMN